MAQYEFLKQIENIEKNNLFLSYVIDRVQDDNYRGVQCSQHNRLTFEYFRSVLEVIFQKAGYSKFGIHIGDYPNDYPQKNATLYYQIVDKINSVCGKGTINSIKKNTFPDIARMGFFERFDKQDNLIEEKLSIGEHKTSGHRDTVCSVKLSQLACQFIEGNEFKRRKLFTDAIDKLTENSASELVDLLTTTSITYIDILEFMYIFSDDRDSITYNDKINYLLEYRKLDKQQQEKLTNLLRQYCNPNATKQYGNKVIMRDYGNWKNESQQIFGLLSDSIYFNVLDGKKLILNSGSNFGLFNKTATRSITSKNNYFRMHKIQQTTNYELHHIIPFKMAQNQNDATFIDDARNLIYLHKNKHLEFTRSRNVNLQIGFANLNILFFKIGSIDNIITVNIKNKEALLDSHLVPDMLNYNKQLLQKFYNI